MSILTRKQESNTITFKGAQVEVNTSFDTILKVFELQQDSMFDDFEKLTITMEMLVDDWKSLQVETIEDVGAIVRLCFSLLTKKAEETSGDPLIDFELDAERIYSSFLKDYDIDLREQQGKLTWTKFIALLNTLSDDTPIMKAVGYRAMEIPSEVKGKERERLMKLKKFYELPTQKERREKDILAMMERRRMQLESG